MRASWIGLVNDVDETSWHAPRGMLPTPPGRGAQVRTLLSGIAEASPVSVSPHPRNQALARASSTSGRAVMTPGASREGYRGAVHTAVSFYLVAPQGMLGSGARVSAALR